MRRTITFTALTAAALLAGAPAATAAPPELEPITLHCDDGGTYDVTVNGAGAFTPGHVVDTRGVLVPISFSDGVFTAVLPDGTVVTESLPAQMQGGGAVAQRNPRPVVSCTYEVHFTVGEGDEFLPAGSEVTLTETVTGHLVGRR